MLNSQTLSIHDESQWKPKASRSVRPRRTYFDTTIVSGRINDDLNLTGVLACQVGDY